MKPRIELQQKNYNYMHEHIREVQPEQPKMSLKPFAQNGNKAEL